jgi:hypothetical protein
MNWRKRATGDKLKASAVHGDNSARYVVRLRGMVYRNTDEFNGQMSDVLDEMNASDFVNHDVCPGEEVCIF